MSSYLTSELPFNEAARRWRKAAELNLRGAAKELGISFTYLSKIENGHMEPPSKEVLDLMAATYGVTRLEVFFRAKKTLPEWDRQLFDPLTWYEVTKLIYNLNLPKQIKPLTVYD